MDPMGILDVVWVAFLDSKARFRRSLRGFLWTELRQRTQGRHDGPQRLSGPSAEMRKDAKSMKVWKNMEK